MFSHIAILKFETGGDYSFLIQRTNYLCIMHTGYHISLQFFGDGLKILLKTEIQDSIQLRQKMQDI